MNIHVIHDKVLLSPSDLKPLCQDFEIVGTFNPAVVRFNDEIILLVRVAEWPRTQDSEELTSPRAVWRDGHTEWVVDSFDPVGADTHDPRVFQLSNGRVRLRYISHLRLVRLNKDGTEIAEVLALPDLLPSEPWEDLGLEDPRITRIDDTYYITYVAISRSAGVATALMTTRDFRTFKRQGIIFPTENKNVVFLPEKWNDQFVAYHRPVSHHWIDAPSIVTALSPDAIYWGKHRILLAPRPGAWDSVKVGAGAPPVRIPQGWLLFYHGVSPPTGDSPAGHYCVGAALMDPENPTRIIARSENPLLCPERLYEREGYVPNVIFPTGVLLSEDGQSLSLFVGAADEVVVQLSVQVDDVVNQLVKE